ncbi:MULTISPECIES: hypothetical protein [Paenibacillus]|jgi:hypothetical protein|uniref:Uncharacterized protein n=2 Tax=Paenibacillus lactis TaxID=228574 RepID=G4HBX0_9BACL|nr:hypothetical protein [Paenibacillus lactis]EHB66651.1 hypothetical protein PaelaDRAFT_0875 [Paenibacillus lactis 154]MBP1893846.1 hypothetical protein [Paenibacillus lactis]
MKAVTPERQQLLIQSMQSTLRKLENGFKRMTEKEANTSLIKKRRDAVKIALDSLEHAWQGTEFSYEISDTLEARTVIAGILPSVIKQYENAKEGSPQKTLLERRIASIEAAINALDTISVKGDSNYVIKDEV